MSSGPPAFMLPPVELRLVVDSLDPPTGLAITDGRETWPFVGWLELMQTLEQFADAHALSPLGDDGHEMARPPS